MKKTLIIAAFLSLAGSLSAQTEQVDRAALVSAAEAGSGSYAGALSRSRTAAAVLGQAKAAWWPTLRYSASFSYMTNPPSMTIKAGDLYPGSSTSTYLQVYNPATQQPTGAVVPFQFDFPSLPDEDVTFTLADNFHFEVGLSLEWPIFVWGKVDNSIKSAEFGVQAALIQQEEERRSILSTIDACLYGLSFLREIKGLLGEQHSRAARLIELSENSFAEGFLLETVLAEARLLESQVTVAEYEVTEQIERALLTLRNITALEDLTVESLVLPSLEENRPAMLYTRADEEQALSRLAAENLKLRLLSLQTQVRERQAAVARGGSYGKPDIGLSVQAAYSGWIDDASFNLTAAIGVRGLVWDGGAVLNNVREKDEAVIQAKINEDQGRRDLQDFVRQSLLQLEVSGRRRDYLALSIASIEANRKQAEAAWKAGYGEEREALTRELSLYGARITLLREELAAVNAALKLENVLGIVGE